MRKFDLSLRSSRSSYFATFRHQLTILSKTDALDEEKWLNRSEERFSRNAETDLVCRLLLEKKKALPPLTSRCASCACDSTRVACAHHARPRLPPVYRTRVRCGRGGSVCTGLSPRG